MYAPGESPFHARGATYLGIGAYAKERVQGGMQAVAAALPEGAHRAFVTQSFKPREWYGALPLRPITEILAKLEGQPWEASVAAHAEQLAHADVGLFGRMRLRSRRSERVVERLVQVAFENFDFGEAEILEQGASDAKIVFHGVPQPLGSWFLAMSRGYASALLSGSGASEPEVKGRMIPKGAREGVALVDVSFRVSWK